MIKGDSDEMSNEAGVWGRYDGPCSKLIVHMIATAHTSTLAYTAAL